MAQENRGLVLLRGNPGQAIHVNKKSQSAKAKDFAVSAQMRREVREMLVSSRIPQFGSVKSHELWLVHVRVTLW